MTFYLEIAAIAAIFSRIAAYLFSKKGQHISYASLGVILSILIVVFVCSVAAFRNPTRVGVDTAGYGMVAFRYGKMFSFEYFSSIALIKRYSILSKLVMWFTAHYTKNMFIYLFSFELISFLPAYIVMCKFLKRDSWFGVFIYCCYFLPHSFNPIRQTMACSMILVSLYFLFKKRYIWSMIFIILGYLFHSMAITFLCVLPVYIYLLNYNKFGCKNLVVKYIIVLVFLFIVYAFCIPIAQFLFENDSDYGWYTSASGKNSSFSALCFIVFDIFFVIIFRILKKKKNADRFNVYFLAFLFLIGAVCYLASAKLEFLFRIGEYFIVSWLFLFPKAASCFDGKKEKILIIGMSMFFVIAYCFVFFQIKNFDHSVPYLFADNWNILY